MMAVIKIDLVVSVGILCPLAIANIQNKKSDKSSKKRIISKVRLAKFIFIFPLCRLALSV